MSVDRGNTYNGSEGIETQDICADLERHSNRDGVPGFIYVENGTQLKALQYAKFSVRDLDAMIQEDLGIKIKVSYGSLRERTSRKKDQSSPGDHGEVGSEFFITCLQWDTLFSRISNAIDNLPIARGNNFNNITPNRLKLGSNNYRSLEGTGITLEMSTNFTKILDRNQSIYQQWFQGFINNVHLLNLRPNKWLESDIHA